MGIVTPGLIDWRRVDMSEVIEDICKKLKDANLSGDIQVWVRFIIIEHDKYGNENISYDYHSIAKIPIYEAKKFKSGFYLNSEYHLIENISEAAFGNVSKNDKLNSDCYEFDSESEEFINTKYSDTLLNIFD